MNNKLKAGAAAIAAAAVLTTGGTYALWSKKAPVTGGTITNGTLDIAAANVGWYDTSADRSDAVAIPGINDPAIKGHSIDLTKWEGVPADTIMGVYDINGALSGDNLTATLSVTGSNGAPLVGANGWAYSFQLIDTKTGLPVGEAADSFDKIRFSSSNNSNNVAALPVMDGVTTGAAEYKLLVRAVFDGSTADTEYANGKTNLAGMDVSLDQDRTTDGNGGYINNGPVIQ